MKNGNGHSNEATIFRGGIPYGPDVQRLSEAFAVPSLVEGLMITHEELEKILELKRGNSRYYAVINSWISKQKNENSIIIVWESRVGLKVLDPASILNHAEVRTRQKAGQLNRAVKLFGWVRRDRLDDTGQKRYDHQVRVAAVLAQAVTSAKKELAIELAPIKSLPKPKVQP